MNKIQMHKEICDNLTGIYIAKNHDYGDSFGIGYKEYGSLMAVIRLEDKFSRYKTLCKHDSKVKDESVKDTLMDLANYAIMTIMEIEEKEIQK